MQWEYSLSASCHRSNVLLFTAIMAPLKGEAAPPLLAIIVIVTGPLWGRKSLPFRAVSPIKSSSKIGNESPGARLTWGSVGSSGQGLRSPRLQLGSAEPRPLPAALGPWTSFLSLSPVRIKKGKALTVLLFPPLRRFACLGCVVFPWGTPTCAWAQGRDGL